MKKSNQYSYSDLLSIVWIAICAFVLCFGISEFINYEFSFYYSLSIYFATLFIYLLANINSIKVDLKLILIIISLFLAFFFYLLLPFQLKSFLIEGFLFVISAFYVLPPLKYKPTIREVPGIKMFVIALVWVCSCYLIPALNKGIIIDWYVISALFLFFLSIIIPFDIRDVRNDNQQLRTLPQVIGVKVSIKLALIFSVLSLVLIYFSEMPAKFFLFYSFFTGINVLLIAAIKYILRAKIYFLLLDSTIFLLGLIFIWINLIN